mmetsp:Transcript_21004/g.62670  ORF Transcript_21004/g.62670 Transcript_21004/m.62670 type:complete len:217 (+) Transcript_21004:151-801(+)
MAPAPDSTATEDKIGLAFNVLGVAMAMLICIAGIMNLVWSRGIGDAQRALLGCYFLVFGALAGVMETMEVKKLVQWAPLMMTFWGRGLYYIFWGILVAGAGGVAFAVLGTICVVFGFLYVLIPPLTIRDYHLGPYTLAGTRHAHNTFDVESADQEQLQQAYQAEKQRADFAEQRYITAERDLAEAKAELKLIEGRLSQAPAPTPEETKNPAEQETV